MSKATQKSVLSTIATAGATIFDGPHRAFGECEVVITAPTGTVWTATTTHDNVLTADTAATLWAEAARDLAQGFTPCGCTEFCQS